MTNNTTKYFTWKSSKKRVYERKTKKREKEEEKIKR